MTGAPESVIKNVMRLLEHHLGQPVRILEFTPVAGGCINHGGRLKTSNGNYFIKWNSNSGLAGMFEAEAKGLRILKQTGVIHIPEVINWFEGSHLQGIVLECISSSQRVSSYWSALGSQLADLHKNTQSFFGLDHSNYIGSLAQFNKPTDDWSTFFIQQRLEVQLKLAIDHRRLDAALVQKFESLYGKLSRLLPAEKPCLLHGDLWSGNVIVDETGEPCLIDPAVYYGHRESELAFTTLFGGFDDDFYSSYNQIATLQPDFEERVDIYNLYPLLVHVNLFGGGYARQVSSIVNRFA
jgi:protein-ribulosamine 3-kinase